MLKLKERPTSETPVPNEPVSPELTGRIIKWDAGRGFGFVHTGERRVFLHIREFSEHHKRPEPGDQIRFTLGTDDQNRPYAQKAVHQNDGGRITIAGTLVPCCLMILPVFALYRRDTDLRWVAGVLLGIGAITYWQYAADKKRARAKSWRISEARLHILELMGGWTGAWLAQRSLRHKCSKAGYQFTFWLIILLWQLIAFDSLQNWNLLKQLWTWAELIT